MIHVWLLLFNLQLCTCCEFLQRVLLQSIALSFLYKFSNRVRLVTAQCYVLVCLCDDFLPDLFVVIFELFVLVDFVVCGWAAVHLPHEPLRCPVQSVVWYKCLHKDILLPARIDRAHTVLSIGFLVVRGQVTVETLEAARAKAARSQHGISDQLVADLASQRGRALCVFGRNMGVLTCLVLISIYFILSEQCFDDSALFGLPLVVLTENRNVNLVDRNSFCLIGIVLWVSVCGAVLYSVAWFFAALADITIWEPTAVVSTPKRIKMGPSAVLHVLGRATAHLET